MSERDRKIEGSRGEEAAREGLRQFRLQRYEEAALHYQSALERDPENPQLREMFDRAAANAISEVNIAVPPIRYFDRAELLAPATVPSGALPPPPRPAPARSAPERLWTTVGNLLGAMTTVVMTVLTRSFGAVAGYRGQVWTNWYRRSLHLKIITLAYMRDKLNKKNLISTYPPGALIGFQSDGQTPPEGVTHYRTADGSWNNLANPKEGAAGTRFLRNVRPNAAFPETGTALLTPNPREISRKLLTRTGPMTHVPFLNLLAASWIQFQTHDWVNHGESRLDKTIEIPLEPDDPLRAMYQQEAMLVGRTQADPTRMDSGENTPVTFINEVTHWWDGSQIYGSDQETVDRLRSGVDGRLRLQEDGTLPLTADGVEDSGYVRNWWLGLAMLHTLFAKEHNAICRHLKTFYPHWDDRRLFNVARLVNAAVMAKIHTVEWTPAILPNRGVDVALNANWFGIATNLFRRGRQRNTLSSVNIRNPELGGVVGNPLDRHGQPYGLTEEFVEVYRLHSLLPESLDIRKIGTDELHETIPMPLTRQAGSRKITSRLEMADLFHSFGNQHPGALVLNNFPRFMQNISVPGNPMIDVGAIDILRARERGVPRYNEFRRQLGLHAVPSFEELTPDRAQVAKLKEVYGAKPGDIEMLDLMIGTLAEGHRPDKFGFGETLFQIFILNATRRLQADRFYTDDYNEATYTHEGLQWVDDADLKTVLLRHYPQLAASGLANVTNAFEPWDRSQRLDCARHPLRAYDRRLKDDPWLGDASR